MLNKINEIKKELAENKTATFTKYKVSEFTFEELKELFTLAHENGLDTGCQMQTGTLEFSLKH